MATAIYHGFLIHALATMTAGQLNNAKVTPSTFVLLFAIFFDIVCMATMIGAIFG